MGMNKEMKAFYDKALKLYHNGELKKSLECCEEGISKDLKNNSLLNLKGLILYLKGDLEGAIIVWKINKDFNNDEISKTYIKDAENDKERQQYFGKAKELIKTLDINEAIENLEICRKSDFNSIQVNNLLAFCEFKKGDYHKSREYVNKVLGIDKRNSNAISIKKEIEEFSAKKKIKTPLIVGIVFIISVSMILTFSLKNKEDKLVVYNNIENGDKDNIDESKNDRIGTEKKVESVEEVKEIEEVIEENVTPEQVEENYIKASTYFDEANYIASKESLEKVVKQSSENHLNDDILFLIGSTYEKLNDLNNSAKYFEKYISLYKNGDYIEEVYYSLALQYKSINREKSIYYANEIRANYNGSIYNNDNIESILVN